ncbi:MAG: hypothetical protein QGG54_01540 [Gammaproteobacteria bacterium]|nr:hypothetical protein [Gammaproteobacteria bacterium]MDP6536351.1 hypothetical protein [Gammaproteobacteria bacterium]MDP6733489.1 hypothetical protein [Gammaproteobacteria bacterium]HAJ75231.1 hypothetical protein [Gammaproteobacteria bacterium]
MESDWLCAPAGLEDDEELGAPPLLLCCIEGIAGERGDELEDELELELDEGDWLLLELAEGIDGELDELELEVEGMDGMLEELWLIDDWQASRLKLIPLSKNSLGRVFDGFFIILSNSKITYHRCCCFLVNFL